MSIYHPITYLILACSILGCTVSLNAQSFDQQIDSIYNIESIDSRVEGLQAIINSNAYADHPDTLALLYFELSYILFRNNISIESAIAALDQGLSIVSLDHNKEVWLQLCYYKGYWYRKWDKYDEAKDALQLVLDVKKDNPYLWSATIQLGKTFKDRGDFSLALDTYDVALSLADNNKDRLATNYEVISFVYLIMENEEGARKAIPWLEKLIGLLEDMPEEVHFLASMTYNLGTAYLTLEEYACAKKYFQEAEDLIDACCDDDDFKSLLMESRASILAENGKYDEAIELYHKSMEMYEESFDLSRSDGLAGTLHLLAATYQAKGDPINGLKYINAALEYRLTGIDGHSSHILSAEVLRANGEKHYLIDELLTLSQLYYDLYLNNDLPHSLDQAIRALEYCELVVDFMRLEVIEESSKLFWRERTSQVYDRLIDLYYESGAVDKAFYAAEKSKYLLTGEHLVVKRSSQNDAGEIKEVGDLHNIQLLIDEATLVQRNQNENTKIEDIDTINTKLVAFKNEKDDILHDLKEEYPSYYRDNFMFDIASIEEVQSSIIGKSQSLIEYHLTEEFVYTFLINRDSLHLVRSETASALVADITRYRNCVSSEDRMHSDSLTVLYELSARLYDHLLRPVDKVLHDNIVIVPHDVLAFLPFGTLIDDRYRLKTGIRLSKWPFLVHSKTISYAYSASLALQNTKQSRTGYTNNQVLAIRPSFVESSNSSVDKAMAYGRNAFGELLGAQEEVSYLRDMLSGEVLEADDATKKQLMKNLTRPWGVLHIASHAVADDEQYGESYILLQDTDDNNGHLHSYEIAKMDMDVDLVVLSACQTGFGKQITGEGVGSIGHSFVKAGGRNILTSLWSVNDQSTSLMMQHFYKGISGGAKVSDVLQQSQKYLLNEAPMAFHHPFYWGGFVSIGQGEIDLEQHVMSSNINYTSYLWWSMLLVGVWSQRRKINLLLLMLLEQFKSFIFFINVVRDDFQE